VYCTNIRPRYVFPYILPHYKVQIHHDRRHMRRLKRIQLARSPEHSRGYAVRNLYLFYAAIPYMRQSLSLNIINGPCITVKCDRAIHFSPHKSRQDHGQKLIILHAVSVIFTFLKIRSSPQCVESLYILHISSKIRSCTRSDPVHIQT